MGYVYLLCLLGVGLVGSSGLPNGCGSGYASRWEIFGFILLLFSQKERKYISFTQLFLLSLYIFLGKFIYFSIFEC